MKNGILIILVLFTAIALVANVSYAKVLYFDDIPTDDIGGTAIPNGYGGDFIYNSGFPELVAGSQGFFGSAITLLTPGSGGYNNAVINNGGFLYAHVKSFSPFDFNGAYFASPVNITDKYPEGWSSTTITMRGYNGANEVSGSGVTYNLTGAFEYCPANLMNIDKLELISSGNYKYWLMDNLTFNQVVPEPSSLLLMSFGGIITAFIKRRRKA